MDERARRELVLTRRLYMLWAVIGLAVVVALCYVVYGMFRTRAPQPALVGAVDDFAANSVTLRYINADFNDPETAKELATLSLDVVRDPSGAFTVFYARSTDPVYGSLPPRQCVVQWDDAAGQFVEPCGGSAWSRDGKYISGPAPRDLDRFPAVTENGELRIQLQLTEGAPHP